MTRLIQFEMKKLFRSTFFRIILSAFCLFIIAYFVFIFINTLRADDLVWEAERDSQRLIERIEELKAPIESGEVEATKQMNEEIEFWESFLAKDLITLKAYEEEDWTTLLDREVKEVEQDIEIDVFNREYYTSSYPTLFTRETRMEQQKLMRDKGIVPVLRLDGYAWLTTYDVAFPIEGTTEEIHQDFVERWSAKHSSTGIYYLNHVFNLLFGVIGAGVFLFLVGDVVTKEGLGRNGPIHLLHTQPIQRHKILVSKFLTVLFVSMSILIGTAVVSLLLGTIFDRFGDWNYPVLIYGEDYAYEFINMSTFLMKSAGLFFMVLLFCYSLLFLFSILTKRVLIALGLTLATILIGIKLSEEAILSSFSPYIPFHYFSVSKIVTMELAVTLKNFDFNLMNGIIVLGISSMVLFVLTFVSTVLQNKFSR